jgi:molybdopterin converting factor small subunit
MRITIQFMGQARLAAGCERTTVEIDPPATALAALQAAAAKHGAALRDFLFHDDGRPRRSVLLAVDQRQMAWESDEPLDDGAGLTVLPPIAGG